MKQILSLLLFCLLSMPLWAQKEADQILGKWYNTEKSAQVEIYACGDRYCGKIVWLKEPTYEDGTAKIDKNNPEEKLRSRALMGLNLLTGFEYDEDNVWEDGEIYDPKEGKTYSCMLTLKPNGELEVRGYVGFSLIGKTVIWTRVK
ncbi:DUF2147 domain-containing protein [Cytophagales bacterium LB-30]|uniref:DUF2147 domain-containing protein n=1 Tax=Shiella aurantiaca TaxID=3058365 RepID=A0ABT8F4E0_9BACT|nr:DUF2147 domain-containing protein [Shiella aurantiaca]MDN4165322.1 DUF2147 domain-containing protein [Shiella aurantiaca]